MSTTKKKLKKVFENRERQQNQNQPTFKMSHQNNVKPNCKVCRDAGKSEQECSSHWVRDKSGRVTCPTLISQNCRNCGKCGHTLKYCKNETVAQKKQTEKKEPTKESQTQNKYAVLADHDSLPILTPKKISYLDILAKAPAPQKEIGKIVNLKDLKKSTFNLVPFKLKHSWASETSSETTEYETNNEPEFNDCDSEDERICPSIPKPVAVAYN